MIDAHIHLDHYDRDSLASQIEEWKTAGIEGVIAVSNDLSSSYRTLELQQQYPTFVYACLGFHPENPLPSEHDLLEWESLLKAEAQHVYAVGEIGLPHYNVNKLPSSLHEYMETLERLLYQAKQLDLPIALHAVHDKAAITYRLLQKVGIAHAHFHWLKAPKEVVTSIINAGYHVSVTPEVCYRERDQRLLQNVPLSQLMIETDGPWPYKDQFEGVQTTPLFLHDIAKTVSQLKGISLEQIQRETSWNVKNVYRLS